MTQIYQSIFFKLISQIIIYIDMWNFTWSKWNIQFSGKNIYKVHQEIFLVKFEYHIKLISWIKIDLVSTNIKLQRDGIRIISNKNSE